MTEPETPELRVAVADDHYLVREGIRQLLELEHDLRVTACVGDVDGLLAAVETGVDAVITDIRMPGGAYPDGVAAAHGIRRHHPHVGVVVLSAHADDAYARRLFAEGTAGLAYLLKDRVGDRAELARAVRATARGDSVVDPWVVDAILRRNRGRALLDQLTPRELDVLARMAAGESNPAIGAALHLSGSAVEKHVGSIFAKLQLAEEPSVNRRVAAVLAYLEGGVDLSLPHSTRR
jgi:DNA-binding NarL/FixJ family response regulator